MGAGAACQIFQPLGNIKHLLDLRVLMINFAQLVALFEGLFQFDVESFGNHLADFVDPMQGNPQRPADVADGGFGFQRAERADLCNVLFAVLLLRVIDDRLATVAAEIDVDIWRFFPAGVQKPLEQQVVFQRADITQSQNIRNNGTAGGTARLAGDFVFQSKANEIPDDQKIARIPHLFNDAQFVIEPFLMYFGHLVAVSPIHSLFAQFAEVLGIGFVLRRREDWEMPRTQIEVDINPLGNFLSSGDGIGMIGKGSVHLLRSTDEEFVVLHLHPVDIAA